MPRLLWRSLSLTKLPKHFDIGAVAPVGTDRWAVREEHYGAPTGHALPAATRFISPIAKGRWYQFSVGA
jgi:hypothetical protein